MGRRTAGTYIGDFSGRNCFVCSGRLWYRTELCGEVGEAVVDVPEEELLGDGC